MLKSSTEKQIVAVDIDDTLAESTEALRKEVNKTYKVNLKAEDYLLESTFEMGYYFKIWKQHGLDVDLTQLSTDMTKDQLHVDATLEAQKVLASLADDFDFKVVTSRDLSWKKATYSWIENKFSEIFSEVLFTDEFLDSYGDPISKGELCQKTGASLLIDDNPDFCESAKAAGIETILFGSYGWHGLLEENEFKRCLNWNQVEKQLITLKENNSFKND